MSTWYQLSQYGNAKITRIEVRKETAQFVEVGESFLGGPIRFSRRSKAGEFFPSFDAAKNYAVERGERKLQAANDERSRAIEWLKKARELEEL